MGWMVVIVVAVVVGGGTALWWRRRGRGERLQEDILKRFFQCRQQAREVQLEALVGMLRASLPRIRRGLGSLIGRGLVRADGSVLRLTADGREVAGALVRRHRVLETYLAERRGRPLPKLHALADRLEHRVSQDRIEAMDRLLGYPVRDPHGDLIPRRSGTTRDVGRVSLELCPAGSQVSVLHVEDEPEALFRELLAAGIVPGAELEVRVNDDAGVTADVAGIGPQRLGALLAGLVDVVPSVLEAGELRAMVRLSDLPIGQSGRVVMLTNELRGDARRRLLDLGFTPGALVRPVLENALGSDPMAYAIRQSKIALRRGQACHVLVARAGAERQAGDGAAP